MLSLSLLGQDSKPGLARPEKVDNQIAYGER
jgi:hypothetical protein